MYCRSLTLAHPNMGCAVPMKIFLKIEMLYRTFKHPIKAVKGRLCSVNFKIVATPLVYT